MNQLHRISTVCFQRSFRRAKRRSRSGVTAVEVAICLPVLFLMLFGCYELARANMLHHMSQAAAYEGARVGIIPGANQQSIRDEVQRSLQTVGVTDFTVTISPSDLNNQSELVLVEVEVPMRTNTTIGLVFTKNASFRGQCELSREVN